MKYISALFFTLLLSFQTFGQSQLPDYFLDGKAVVLISCAPDAKPIMEWKEIAETIHPALVETGGDPIAYYELEEVILSEEIQAAYAKNFEQRMVRNIVTITRKSSGDFFVNIMEFSGNGNLIKAGNHWSLNASAISVLNENLIAAGKGLRSKNLMALDVPAFLPPLVGGGENSSSPSGNQGPSLPASTRFIAKNPLNLDVFKLGIPLSGASGEAALLTQFRYDLLGKSSDQILAAQRAEKASLENILKEYYPYETVFLTEIRSADALIKDRIQFVLMRVEGREADLMESMGLNSTNIEDPNRIVVKYYIKFLVRNELYTGPVWDADPDGKTALINFLKNLNQKQ
ncbi:NTPase [Echinicola sp. CAU 1574]|uniref:NTPase n=1 Tax=Echinicola arenosa TaxID=2774144 RepID=A0ABR9AKA7_9BACT|nr:NTPase [Echinicola arenosa]MBD8488777.1 NTPase [Echinicola arenosa]